MRGVSNEVLISVLKTLAKKYGDRICQGPEYDRFYTSLVDAERAWEEDLPRKDS